VMCLFINCHVFFLLLCKKNVDLDREKNSYNRRNLRHKWKKEGVTDVYRSKLKHQEIMHLNVIERHGVVFAGATDNCRKQQALVGATVARKGSHIGAKGNPVKSWTTEEERRKIWMKKSIEGAFVLKRKRKASVVEYDWKKTVVFFFGNKDHMPELPQIDLRKMERRKVLYLGVEEHLSVPKIQDSSRPIIGSEKSFCRFPRHRSVLHASQAVYSVLEDIVRKHGSSKTAREDGHSQRIACLDGDGSCYVSLGQTPNLFGGGLKENLRGIDTDKRKMAIFLAWVKAIEHNAKQFLPREVLKLLEGASKEGTYSFGDENWKSLWSALAFGLNVFLNVHTDKDMTESLTTVVAGPDVDPDMILFYFCFPVLGVAVPLRSGDCLSFNPQEPHCVSSRCHSDINAFCCSFYLPAGVPGKNKKDQGLKLTIESERQVSLVLNNKKLL
jgi:hypothetical protein